MSPKRELAAERTDLAADRTALAGERTYAAWVRTGLTSLAAGLAVLRFMQDVLRGPSLRLVALALIGYGAFCFAAAAWRYWRTNQLLERSGVRRLPTPLLLAATLLLGAAALAALANAWIADLGPGR